MTKFLIIGTLCFLVGCASSGGSTNSLTKMANDDQQIRQKLADAGGADTVLGKEMLSMDSAHTKVLKDTLHGRPWFDEKELKMRDRISAFMLLDHSPDTALQAAALPVLKQQASKMGPDSKQFVASLEDRVLMEEGKPQVYGTQVNVVGDSLIVYTIGDPTNVDSRRSSIGLPPLQQYLDMLRSMIPKK